MRSCPPDNTFLLPSDAATQVLDASKPTGHKEILTRELESVGIRLNRSPPNIFFKCALCCLSCAWLPIGATLPFLLAGRNDMPMSLCQLPCWPHPVSPPTQLQQVAPMMQEEEDGRRRHFQLIAAHKPGREDGHAHPAGASHEALIDRRTTDLDVFICILGFLNPSLISSETGSSCALHRKHTRCALQFHCKFCPPAAGLQEYKIHNCDILFKEDSTVDDLIDIIEVIYSAHCPNRLSQRL